MLMKLNIFTLLTFSLTLIISCSNTQSDPPEWKSLFDGETLDGWKQKGGEAIYEVENGFIKGTTVPNTPNSFLTTTEHFDDFILEYEVRLSDETNSGVQIRSNSFPEYQYGRVHGYQVEIDPSDRAWTGGIYDEGRRGWLFPLKDLPEAQQAYNHLEWNKFRVEAIGDTIKTWVNDVPVSHLVDNRTNSGFIGLQVHSIKNEEDAGISIQWRNMKIITDNPRKYATETPISAKDNYNKLTHSQEDWGWELLYDGTTVEKWRGARMNDFPHSPEGTGWDINNGVIKIHESGGQESANAGDIVTRELYSDFELWVDFKITPGANSGIKYFVDADLNQGEGSAIGLEYQILDDQRHPDANLGSHEGSRTMASLYDLIKAEDKKSNPIGEWNHARIISDGNHVEHWLNGRKVLEYERNTPTFKKLVDNSKYADWPGFGTWEEGNILLQDHGNEVSFRNIFLRKIN